jgi:hypothetical protein
MYLAEPKSARAVPDIILGVPFLLDPYNLRTAKL